MPAPTDAAPTGDAQPHVEAGKPVATSAGAVSFALVNETGKSVFIQTNGADFHTLYREGVPLRSRHVCEVCACDPCPACAVCGRALATVKELVPGAVHTFGWDGQAWIIEDDGCRPQLDCERPTPVPAGPMEVQVTYSFTHAVDTSLGANDDVIGEPLTTTQSFLRPAAGVVQVVLRP